MIDTAVDPIVIARAAREYVIARERGDKRSAELYRYLLSLILPPAPRDLARPHRRGLWTPPDD